MAGHQHQHTLQAGCLHHAENNNAWGATAGGSAYSFLIFGRRLRYILASRLEKAIRLIRIRIQGGYDHEPITACRTEGLGPHDFANPNLQAVHDRLMREGEASLEGAIRAGLWIEDHDIADLRGRLGATAAPDLKVLYQNLIMGSRNHLRAFARQAAMRGVAYEPSGLSRADFDAIAASPHESGQCVSDPDFVFSPGAAPGAPNRGQGQGRMRRGQGPGRM